LNSRWRETSIQEERKIKIEQVHVSAEAPARRRAARSSENGEGLERQPAHSLVDGMIMTATAEQTKRNRMERRGGGGK
jgi:hypothetical protein